MPSDTGSAAVLRSSAPVLCVSEIGPMLAYFQDQLGFRLQGSAGELPSWASLQRDGVEIMLVCGDYPAPAADWAAYLYVDDADALYGEQALRLPRIRGEIARRPVACVWRR